MLFRTDLHLFFKITRQVIYLFYSAFGCPYDPGNLNKDRPLLDRLLPGRGESTLSKKAARKSDSSSGVSAGEK